MAGKGILIGMDGDLMISGKRLVIGGSEMQEVSVILQLVQGEQKFMPALGANLIQLTTTKVRTFDMEDRAKIHLALDGKSYDQVREQIQTNFK